MTVVHNLIVMVHPGLNGPRTGPGPSWTVFSTLSYVERESIYTLLGVCFHSYHAFAVASSLIAGDVLSAIKKFFFLYLFLSKVRRLVYLALLYLFCTQYLNNIQRSSG
jgi:hypothetical protein